MMPDLGAYAGPVLAAYAVTLALLGGLVAISLVRSAQARRAVAEREARVREARHGGR